MVMKYLDEIPNVDCSSDRHLKIYGTSAKILSRSSIVLHLPEAIASLTKLAVPPELNARKKVRAST